jgi:hypothetical protein
MAGSRREEYGAIRCRKAGAFRKSVRQAETSSPTAKFTTQAIFGTNAADRVSRELSSTRTANAEPLSPEFFDAHVRMDKKLSGQKKCNDERRIVVDNPRCNAANLPSHDAL